MTRKPFVLLLGDPKGTRTPVPGVRGRCPRPLDDGARLCCLITDLCLLVNVLLVSKVIIGCCDYYFSQTVSFSVFRPRLKR